MADPAIGAIAQNTADTIRQLQAVQAEVRRLPAGIKQALAGGRAAGAAAPGRGGAAGAGAAGGGAAAGGADFSAALSGLARGATAAAGALLGLGPAVLKAALPFVEAFNPALIERFHYAVSNLMAAIGSFLTPIVEVARVVADQLNGIFTSLASTLGPMIARLAETFGAVVSGLAEALLPIFEMLLPVMRENIEIFRRLMDTLMPVVTAVAQIGAVLSTLSAVILSVVEVALQPLFLALRVLAALIDAWFKAIQPIMALFNTFRELLSEIMDAVGALIGDVAKLVGELVKSFVELIFEVIPFKDIVQAVTSVMRTLKDAILDVINFIRGLLRQGPLSAATTAPERARTTAAGEARFIDILEIGRQARLAAAGQANIAQQQLDVLELIRRGQEALPGLTAAALALVLRPNEALGRPW
jgi:hypothetical protein